MAGLAYAHPSELPPVVVPRQGDNGETAMLKVEGKTNRSLQPTEDPNTSGRVSTAELVDFLQVRALKYRVKDLCTLTGLSEKAVINLRTGEAGASAQTISTWCRNDPAFRAEYFYWCGGRLEGEPETLAALNIAINNILRRGG